MRKVRGWCLGTRESVLGAGSYARVWHRLSLSQNSAYRLGSLSRRAGVAGTYGQRCIFSQVSHTPHTTCWALLRGPDASIVRHRAMATPSRGCGRLTRQQRARALCKLCTAMSLRHRASHGDALGPAHKFVPPHASPYVAKLAAIPRAAGEPQTGVTCRSVGGAVHPTLHCPGRSSVTSGQVSG